MVIIVGGAAGAKIATEIFQGNSIGYVETFWKEKQPHQIHEKMEDAIDLLKEKDTEYFVATGENTMRKNITSYLIEKTGKFPINCIHSSAIISPSVRIGYGNLICPNTVIHTDAEIGNGTIINTGSIVEHDCLVDDYAQISPGATLCGYVKVGKRAFVSANSTLIPYIEVGEDSVIAAGSSVIENVMPRTLVAGCPAKFKKNK